MTRLCSLIFIPFFTIACNSHKDPKQIPFNKRDTPSTPLYERDTLANNSIRLRPNYSLTKIDTSNIKLAFFDTIPETISSMGEFYSYDTTKIANNKYIFLTNLTDYAIIRVNGKDVYLLKDHDKCLALSENTFKDVFSGNGFTVIFTHKGIDHNNGTSYETGTLEIKNSKYQAIFKIHGGYKL
jgi:hypothetical protein